MSTRTPIGVLAARFAGVPIVVASVSLFRPPVNLTRATWLLQMRTAYPSPVPPTKFVEVDPSTNRPAYFPDPRPVMLFCPEKKLNAHVSVPLLLVSTVL
ncbi:MAG: hypothetical protein BWY91_01481 [bacterium ADurb.BinA028]|nr:MAG: hypothetical protein BWY91_01481 [bacterium ADurb.BinA028]